MKKITRQATHTESLNSQQAEHHSDLTIVSELRDHYPDQRDLESYYLIPSGSEIVAFGDGSGFGKAWRRCHLSRHIYGSFFRISGLIRRLEDEDDDDPSFVSFYSLT